MTTDVTCPECGERIGDSNGKSIYKHVVQQWGLPDKGAAQLLKDFKGKEDPRSKRITEMLTAAVKQQGGA